MLFEGLGTGGMCAFLNFCALGVFQKAHQQQCRSVVIWDMKVYPCCYSRSVSEWLPWALSRTRHRASCSKQLWRNSNTLLFSPWPAL